jgi:hypothetical protein
MSKKDVRICGNESFLHVLSCFFMLFLDKRSCASEF